ncbi:uncharacterized protein DS421_1g03410 [Arachis hypogaea]|nr:uncharacterized protein DS421_1g03410 [Arachis hypogaea]
MPNSIPTTAISCTTIAMVTATAYAEAQSCTMSLAHCVRSKLQLNKTQRSIDQSSCLMKLNATASTPPQTAHWSLSNEILESSKQMDLRQNRALRNARHWFSDPPD